MRGDVNKDSPEAFSDHIPGNWSSHPAAMSRQRPVLILISLLPIAVFLLCGAFVLTDFDSWVGMFRHASVVLLVAGSVVSFSFGAMTTLLTLRIVGRVNAHRKVGLHGRDELPMPLGMMLAFGFFWLVPWALSCFRNWLWDGPYFGVIQFALNLMCFLPFVGILLLAILSGPPTDAETGRSRSKCLAAVGFLFLSLAALSLVTDFQSFLLKCWPDLGGLFGHLDRAVFRLISFATLFPLSMVFIYLWQLVWRVKKSVPKEDGGGKSEVKSGEVESAVQVATPRTLPPCAAELREHLPEGVTLDEDIALRPIAPSGEWSELSHDLVRADRWRFFMDGLTPTEDQVGFFERFAESYDEAIRQFLDGEYDGHFASKSDLLLYGVEGSGRTEALSAVALYSALGRGQRVLYVVPSKSVAKNISTRLNARLKSLSLNCYLSVERLIADDVRSWNENGVPSVLVATPSEVEKAFFGFDNVHDDKAKKAIERVLPTIGVVLVDDFLEYEMPVRAHLAFILRKIKLVDACQGLMPQFVVAIGNMSQNEGLNRLGKDLFGDEGYAPDKNARRLRPRWCRDFWYGALRVKSGLSLDVACSAIVEACLRNDCKALLYRKNKCASDGIALKSDAEGRFLAISNINEIHANAPAPDWVLYLSLTCGDAGSALRLSLPDDPAGTDSVFLRIYSEDEITEHRRDELVLIPDQTAVPLRMHHLLEILPFVPEAQPISDDIWKRFGVSVENPCVRKATGANRAGETSDIRWEYDSLFGKDALQYSDRAIWPYYVLLSKLGVLRQAWLGEGLEMLPESRLNLWCDGECLKNGRRQLVLAEELAKIRGGVARSRIFWKDAEGAPLGYSDAVHLQELVLPRDGETCVIRDLIPRGDGKPDDCAFGAVADPQKGEDIDAVIGVRNLKWTVPLDGLFVRSVMSDVEKSCAYFMVERKSGADFRIDGAVCGLITRLGRGNMSAHMDYSYEAYLSCLVLAPTIDYSKNDASSAEKKHSGGAERYVRKCMAGRWSTRQEDGFSPALTYALTIAFQERIAGFSYFSALPAFYIEGREGSVGRVVLWFVEPVSSGRMVYPLVRDWMQKRPSFDRDIFERAKEILMKYRQARELRVLSRVAYLNDEISDGDLSAAIQVLDMMLEASVRADYERRRLEEIERENKERRAEKEIEDRRDIARVTDGYTKEEREFDQCVVGAITKFETEIDVLRFVTEYRWSKAKISEMFNDVLWNHPELFYVGKYGYHYQWTKDSGGKYVRFIIKDILYEIGPGDVVKCRAELEKATAKALEMASRAKGGLVGKVRALHDFIITACDYDHAAADDDDSDTTYARSAYSVLVRHRAVCEGYTMAFRYLLHRIGVRSEEILSDAMEHCWNYVLIHGRWYHVDVTWDDNGRQYHGNGEVSYRYFLLSDAAMKARKHHDWSTRGLPPATDSWYDNYVWDVNGASGQGGTGQDDKVTENLLEKYRGHVAFRAQNRGCSLSCRGKIVIRVFFVDDSASSWDEAAKDAFKRVVFLAAECLVNGAKDENLKIEVVPAYSDKTVSCEVMSTGTSGQWIAEIFGLAYSSELVADQNRFRRVIGCDESPIVFAFNKDFRSCARSSESGAVGRRDDFEWSMVSYRPDDGVESIERTLVHELLHQFGAIDLYYPKRVSEAADDYLKGSVMRSGTKIDDLTKVLIGWRTTLSPKAIKFLEATKDITEKQIENALEQEWKKKWRG